MHKRLVFSMTRGFQSTAAVALLIACSSNGTGDDGAGGTPGSGGSAPSSGGKGSGGTPMSSGGTTSSGGSAITLGGAPLGSGGVSGASSTGGATSSGGAGMGGAKSSGGSAGAPATSGGSGTTTGGTASGGNSSGGTGTAGTGTAGSTSASGGSGNVTPPTGDNSVAYIGCSMAYNIGTGYKRVGGKVMWNADNYQTSGMVVQNWTDSNSASWQLFDQKMNSIGGKDTIKAIMVQICIFSSRATDAELKSMIASVRKHVNPGTHVYIVGQPQYEAGHECSLAGTGGAKWTDDQAKALAADSSINEDMTYLGQFKLDSTKGEVLSDSCHASSPTGENALGNEAKAFFGG